jgi:hypothetical protein
LELVPPARAAFGFVKLLRLKRVNTRIFEINRIKHYMLFSVIESITYGELGI